MSVPKSASEYATITFLRLIDASWLKQRPRSSVPLRYLTTFFAAFQWDGPGLAMYCPSCETGTAKSGLVDVIIYIREPTKFLYGCSVVDSSDVSLESVEVCAIGVWTMFNAESSNLCRISAMALNWSRKIVLSLAARVILIPRNQVENPRSLMSNFSLSFSLVETISCQSGLTISVSSTCMTAMMKVVPICFVNMHGSAVDCTKFSESKKSLNS